MDGEPGALGRRTRLLDSGLVGEKRPPARTMKRLIVGLRRLLESTAFKKLARGVRKLWQQAMLLGDAVTILHAG